VSKILEEMMNLVILFEKMISPLRNAKKKKHVFVEEKHYSKKVYKIYIYIYIIYIYVKYIVIICYNYILRDVTSNRSTLP